MSDSTRELAARERALELGAEDEYGLYELVWSLNAAFGDSLDNIQAARMAVRELLVEGRLRILRAEWASTAPSNPVNYDDSLRLIESDEAWQPPSTNSGEYTCFVVA